MAWENKVMDLSLKADEDLSSDQYRYVVKDATSGKIRRPNAATDKILGILQNAPENEDEAAVVRPLGCGGTSKVVLGATLAEGTIVACEYVSATDAGKAQECVSTQYSGGLLLEGGEEDDLGTVLLTPMTVMA